MRKEVLFAVQASVGSETAVRSAAETEVVPGPETGIDPGTDQEERTAFEPIYQVLLHDDDVHDMVFVADCLVRVFAIQRTDAWAIMSEAHCTGVALCCSEPRPAAERHRDKLRSYGLSATIEPSRS